MDDMPTINQLINQKIYSLLSNFGRNIPRNHGCQCIAIAVSY